MCAGEGIKNVFIRLIILTLFQLKEKWNGLIIILNYNNYHVSKH